MPRDLSSRPGPLRAWQQARLRSRSGPTRSLIPPGKSCNNPCSRQGDRVVAARTLQLVRSRRAPDRHSGRSHLGGSERRDATPSPRRLHGCRSDQLPASGDLQVAYVFGERGALGLDRLLERRDVEVIRVRPSWPSGGSPQRLSRANSPLPDPSVMSVAGSRGHGSSIALHGRERSHRALFEIASADALRCVGGRGFPSGGRRSSGAQRPQHGRCPRACRHCVLSRAARARARGLLAAAAAARARQRFIHRALELLFPHFAAEVGGRAGDGGRRARRAAHAAGRRAAAARGALRGPRRCRRAVLHRPPGHPRGAAARRPGDLRRRPRRALRRRGDPRLSRLLRHRRLPARAPAPGLRGAARAARADRDRAPRHRHRHPSRPRASARRSPSITARASSSARPPCSARASSSTRASRSAR